MAINSTDSTYIPLFINPSGLRVLVVGGGSVGTRRALMFRRAGARVIVVAKEFSKELLDSDVELREVRLPEDFPVLEKFIEESDLVVIALSDEQLAGRIAKIALAKGKLVNNAVNHREGNVIVPFAATVLGLGVAITSFGVTGLAARIALEKIVKLIEEDREVNAAIKAMGKLKVIIRSKVADPRDRMKLYDIIHGDSEFREYLRRGDWVSAYLRGLKIIESHNIILDPRYYDVSESNH